MSETWVIRDSATLVSGDFDATTVNFTSGGSSFQAISISLFGTSRLQLLYESISSQVTAASTKSKTDSTLAFTNNVYKTLKFDAPLPAGSSLLTWLQNNADKQGDVPTYTVSLTSGTGYTIAPTSGSTSPVTSGGSYSFTVTILDGYKKGSNFAVKTNGASLTASGDTYTILNITSNQTVTVEGVEVDMPTPTDTYTVTLQSGHGYTVTAVAGYTSPVESGADFQFTVTILSGYQKGSSFAVKANNTILIESSGKYTITNITSNQVVTVTGVEVIPTPQPTDDKFQQDIHLEDKPLWTQFQTEWANGNYAAAIELLKNAALTNKQLNAAVINDITTVITTLENQKDDSFKTDKIKVATEPPSGMSVGEIYFKMLGAISDYNMPDSYYIDPTEKTATGYDAVKLKALANKTYLTNNTAQLFGEIWPNLNVDKALFDLETMLLSISQA